MPDASLGDAAGRPVPKAKNLTHSVSKNSQSISAARFLQFIAQIDHVGQAETQEIIMHFSAEQRLHYSCENRKLSKKQQTKPRNFLATVLPSSTANMPLK